MTPQIGATVMLTAVLAASQSELQRSSSTSLSPGLFSAADASDGVLAGDWSEPAVAAASENWHELQVPLSFTGESTWIDRPDQWLAADGPVSVRKSSIFARTEAVGQDSPLDIAEQPEVASAAETRPRRDSAKRDRLARPAWGAGLLLVGFTLLAGLFRLRRLNDSQLMRRNS